MSNESQDPYRGSHEDGSEYNPDIPEVALTQLPNERLASLHTLLAELDDWADKIRSSKLLDRAEEEKIFHSPLPVALFHATTRANAEQIRIDGLRPSQLEFDKNIVVSLSDSVRYAKFCASITQATNENELVVLEVTTKGLERANTKSFLSFDDLVVVGEKMHEVHYDGVVSPDWIHELSAAEIAELEA